MIDTYTHYVLEYFEQINKTSQLTMQDLVRLGHFHSSAQKANTGRFHSLASMNHKR